MARCSSAASLSFLAGSGTQHSTTGHTVRLARLLLVESHALRAAAGVDDVDVVAGAHGIVGALGLARAAIDALVGDDGCHGPWPLHATGQRAARLARVSRSRETPSS